MYNVIEKCKFSIKIHIYNWEVKNISKKQKKVENKTVFLCKDVDYQNLGREVYADNVDTPFSFYLIRELKLVRDYQNLAEGESYFDAICDSWDAIDDFDDLVVKKIYLYVETEVMYYSLYIGSFKSTRSDLRFRLKEWLANVKVDKKDRSLASKESTMNVPEMQNVMKQLLETSNEIFRLRKIISDLNMTLENERLEKRLATAAENPIISRSIRTIHLKRAQPLIVEEVDKKTPIYSDANFDGLTSESVDTKTEKMSEQSMNEDDNEKKLQAGLAKVESIQENITLEDKTYVSQEKKIEPNEELDESNSDPVPVKLRFKKVNNRKTKDDFSKEDESETEVLNEEEVMLDLSLLVLNRDYDEKMVLKDSQPFLAQVKLHQSFQIPKKKLDKQQKELKKLEDDIYLHFMNKRVRGTTKKNNNQKEKILRSDLFTQIAQAGYLHYSWGQVLKKRNEDLLICGRLSCAHLDSNLDYFLDELKSMTKPRFFFSKSVSCSSDMIRRLKGYILLDEYMQKLSMMSIEDINSTR